MENRENKVWSRCAYGFADIYGGGAFVIISTFFTVFLTKALGMSPALAGTIPLIGKVWDAVTDPLMGNICDRTQSKFGSKRLYILIGSIISAITFLLMWISFPVSNTAGQYFFYMLMYMLFSTGFTIVMVPYNALLPDMVDDYVTRGKFSGTRIIFSTFGAILAGLIPTLIIKDNTNASLYFMVACLFSVLFFIVILVTFFGTWEKQKEPIKTGFKDSFVQAFSCFRGKSFKLFILLFVCGQGAADFVTGLAIYYIDDVLHAYGGGRFTYLMAVLLLSQFVGTFVFSALMPKTSKKFPLLFGFSIRIVATLALLFVSYEGVNFVVILLISAVVGFGMAGSSTTIYAILADMSDIDHLITSVDRPGTVSAMSTFMRKIGAGLSSSIIGILLAIVGYDETLASTGMRQSAFTQRGITYLYVFTPIVMMVISLIATKAFPVTKKEFEIIKKEIARRKGEDTSVASKEEIEVCERVTGFSFDQLWKEENAKNLKSNKH